MSLTFAIHFEGRVVAERAAERLLSEGYQVDLQSQGDGSTVVAASAERPIPRKTDSALELMAQVAKNHGGDLMGHGGLLSIGLDR